MRNVKVQYGIEDLKYRIFGLFPFFAKNDNGDMVLYKGNTLKDGCYGQISCGFTLPCDFILDDKVLLKKDESYTFNTLYYYYKRYNKLKGNQFISFMNKGIGRILVNARINRDKCDLVPEIVNLSECEDLYDTMYKMRILIQRYRTLLEAEPDNINCDIECLIEKYDRMGGDIMLDFYKQAYIKADDIANEYFNYANPEAAVYNINLCITETIKDGGAVEKYTDLYNPLSKYNKGDIVVYDGESYIYNGNDGEETVTSEGYFDHNKFIKMSDAISTTDKLITLKGTSNSKLKSFRKFGDYISPRGLVETPGIDEDWLFYYKKNALASYTTIRDKDNNIDVYGERKLTKGEYDKNLYAYGDILTEINAISKENKIEFVYVIGAHLKAKLVDITVNEFNELIYKYSDFEYDDEDLLHGVKYKEVYYYSQSSEINTLIEDGKFEEFITNDNINKYIKGVFDLSQSISNSITIINGTEIEFSYLPSDFESNTLNVEEYPISPIIKRDYYDGITYTPQINNKVRFSRGNSAAFERHIKLGEVKSFDDFLNYSNGGFFNVLS